MIGKTFDKTCLTLNAIGGSVINITTNYNSRFPEYTKVIVIDISHDVWKKKIGETHNYSEITKVSDIPKLHIKNNKLWSKLGNCFIGKNYIGTNVNIAEQPIVLVDYESNWKKEKMPLLPESNMTNSNDMIHDHKEKQTIPKKFPI